MGAGSSGCVLAARLSENPSRRVLLIEAGPHYRRREDWPQELLRANTFAATLPGQPHNWSFMGELLPGRDYPIPRGKVVGGCSAVNGTYFIRGRPEDFDAWAALGNPSWSYDRVLPSFIRCERDLDVSDALHGSSGPVPIQRARPEQWRPVTQAFVDACTSLGFAPEPDKNGTQAPGVGAIPRNCIAGVRMNAAITHLQPALARANLTVLSGAFVRRVLFRGSKAVGIEADHAGASHAWHASEIVLCAGGIQTPHLLMLSGIGCAAELQEHSIPLVHDNQNVGRHIMDHSTITLPFRVRGDGQPLPEDFMPIQACLNHTTPGSEALGESQISCLAGSLAMMMREPQVGGFGATLMRRLAVLRQLRGLSLDFLLSQLRIRDDLQLNCSLMLPQSRGRLSLVSGDPGGAPRIAYNYLSTEQDRRAVRANVRTAAALLREPAMRRLGARRTALSDAELDDDQRLDAWIAGHMGTAFHTSCGARMGPPDDPLAVVDEFGRVRGVQGLRVADLSISPVIVRRGTSATAVMIGEHIATFFD